MLLFIQYFLLLARFLKGQLQPVVFSLPYSHKSLAKIRHICSKLFVADSFLHYPNHFALLHFTYFTRYTII
ncbi:hypothetical protein BUY31_07745 [Staphylococcus cohnii]|nr:hypothetical protein BUY40_05230 [Staphylococcus cohnii]PTF24212.1 hypothetical protein BUY31_07745 [Staphylococcus cohnii]PTF25516.1 hypothetical protein BUY30_02580 [Staphylococcus cohnii]PTF33310.1 hypothetical protein BUY21_06105 [Staphylococcus cohnii]PTG42173.1 hypothetical protein BUY20_11820 [Staphylococcus cohnii]